MATSCGLIFGYDLGVPERRFVAPSEIYPVEVRFAGQTLSISITLLVSFVKLQVFIKTLCAMKHAVFLFYTGWLVVMTIFVAVFLPEMKGVNTARDERRTAGGDVVGVGEALVMKEELHQ
ncbi:hypothetical protein ACP70R_009755 [Stipagrostis hirtigluma subsp. patula]